MHYSKINLMLPTFKRVERMQRFISTACDKCSDILNLRLTLCVNERDNETREYVDSTDFPIEHAVILEDTTQPNLAKYFNMLYDQTPFNDADALVSMFGDDMFFVTQNWDKRVLDTVNENDGNAIVYCNDNFIAFDKLMVNLLTTRKVVEATRKPFMCERFHAEMIDVVWTNIGVLTGVARYLSDVIVQHEHEMRITDPKKRDVTCRRLQPLRKLANTKENERYAWAYATYCAANLIESGIGKWNVM